VDATTATNIRNNAGANGYLTVQALFRQDAGATVADPEGIGILPSFESAVGASPAVLPRGSHTLMIMLGQTGAANSGKRWPLTVSIAQLAAEAAALAFRADSSNPNNQSDGGVVIAASLRYVAATRTLTYAAAGDAARIMSIYAVGEA
ncbi:MAG: hypothetical protein OXE02_08375, partial [Chloroflexi bacterium]|nr:hypothetical protein [Chloroflexota bacterium]